MELAAVVDVKVVADGDGERAGAILSEKGDVGFLAVYLAVKGKAVGRKGHPALADTTAHHAVLFRVAVGHADDALADERCWK